MLSRQISFLQSLECDVIALQEVSAANGDVLESSGAFHWVWRALDLRPAAPHETTSRDRGCVIVARKEFRPVASPEILEGAAAPERTLVVRLDTGTQPLTVASFHQVAGSDALKWGRAKKRQTFEAIASWAAVHGRFTVFGIDANSPKVDHPDIDQNVYTRDEVQLEHLLHDPRRAPHQLRDVFRRYLEDHPLELDEIRRERPTGPLAVSHVTRGGPRRFDHVFASPDLVPLRVTYRGDALADKLSDHAPVVVDLGPI